MQIIKRGIILAEEQKVADKLSQLPDDWWCIAGDANRFVFKFGEPVQIDFVIIAPQGVFFVESKHVSTIQTVEGNEIRFFNRHEQLIKKSTRRANPVEDIIYYRYIAKDWLTAKAIPDFFSNDGKSLKIFLHGLVVLVNDSVHFKGTSFENLNYVTHRYPTLIKLSQLETSFFDSLVLPANCSKLSFDERWFLFKMFYNPDWSISQIVGQIRNLETQVFEEKKILVEQNRLLDQQNNELAKSNYRLESTYQQLDEQNKEIQSKLNLLQPRFDLLKNENEHIQQLNQDLEGHRQNLIHENQMFVEQQERLNQDIDKKNQEIKQHLHTQKQLDQDISTLKVRVNKTYATLNKSKNKIIKSSWKAILLLIFGVVLIVLAIIGIYLGLMDQKSATILGRIEQNYPLVEKNFKQERHGEVIRLWQDDVLFGKDIPMDFFQNSVFIFFYIAYSYEAERSYENAIQYYNLFSEMTRKYDELVFVHYHRALCYISLNKNLDTVIVDLNEALSWLDYLSPAEQSKWKRKIFLTLGRVYKLIINDKNLREDYGRRLKISNSDSDLFSEAFRYFEQGAKLSWNSDMQMWIEFKLEIGNLHMKKMDYRKALIVFQNLKKVIAKQEQTKYILNYNMQVLNAIATCYSQLHQFLLAQQYYQDVLSILDAQKKLSVSNFNQKELAGYEARVYLSLTHVSNEMGQAPDAKKYLRMAEDLVEQYQLDDVKKLIRSTKPKIR